MVDGRSGIAHLTQFDVSQFEVQIGGEVRDFHPEESVPTKDLRRTDKNGTTVAWTDGVRFRVAGVSPQWNPYDPRLLSTAAGTPLIAPR